MAVQQCHVLDIGILNEVIFPGILSNASHADSVAVIAKQVLHKDIAGVWLGREAVVSIVNFGVCHT